MIHSQKVKFIFDGVDLDFYYQEEQPGISILNRHYDFERGIFGSFTAADIKGVELMSNLKHTSYYNSKYFTMPPADPTAWAYVEITTRDGNGPFINQTPNMAVYRPLPFSLPKQFYRPKYKIKERVVTAKDLRSTIHWEPNIVTDAGGIATVSFYAADLPGSYSVRIEGTDLDGRTSYYSGKLLISPNSAKPD
ncbi:MAG: hypothetical protein EOP45_14255 [Sphingobacteriaceae bacterium]|nr:MAG: hypothetical protein EOP45_14255 [Sphingobacteriaceae bacterium]